MILITGASGNVGKAVLHEVARKEPTFRGMYRSKEEAAKAPAGCEAVLADFSDKASLRKAMDGVAAVYVVCSPIPQLVELESNVIDACKESAVKHVVLNSALGAGDYGKSFPSWHRKVEEKLKSTGLSYTILRPNGFMQNIVAFYAPSIRKEDAFYQAMGDAKVSHIDYWRRRCCRGEIALWRRTRRENLRIVGARSAIQRRTRQENFQSRWAHSHASWTSLNPRSETRCLD